ncbi:hypothetical protein SFRURICE_006893 [Spodoptera frugiperda]|nr:hypothetical protein SFRURICE_006893 [Spodoptera frugiperda]
MQASGAADYLAGLPGSGSKSRRRNGVTALSRRKESAAPLTGERDSTIFRHGFGYPLALVLRLRVLQN